VYADWLRGFGNLLIIDHGHGYMSLYGNNETIYKQVGDSVRSGDTISTVGNSGGNEDSGLYFELRFEGKPIDPAKWVRR
jgi:septal ring factor EnvC (AmiA/AmiB activator)